MCPIQRNTGLSGPAGPGTGAEGSSGARSDLPAPQGLGDAVPTQAGPHPGGLEPFLTGEVRSHGKCGKLMNLENKVALTSFVIPSFLP